MKTLVVYYSLSGKTEIVANAIAAELGADVRRIEEVKPRTNFASIYLAGGRDASQDRCSEIRPCDFSLDGYDTVFIGTPNWANRPVPAINAFIAKADFTNKTVVTFCTMGGRPGYESLFTNLNDKIASRSGRVVGDFSVRTFMKKDQEIIDITRNRLENLPAWTRKEAKPKESVPV